MVINFDAPRTLETYVHRIGRTARAGASGAAVTFVEDGDRPLLKEIAKKTRAQLMQRTVPSAAVAAWQGRAEALWGDVGRVLGEEREEARRALPAAPAPRLSLFAAPAAAAALLPPPPPAVLPTIHSPTHHIL